MKFRCERDPLVEALNAAGRAVTPRASLPVLSGLRLTLEGDQLSVTGSDLELTISVRAAVSGSGDGVAVVPAKLLSDITRALPPGAVTVEIVDDEARISSGRSQFAVRTIPAQTYPQLPEPAERSVALDAAALSDALRQVVSAASNDENRAVLTGVLVAAEGDGLRLVATDSYRLAVCDLPGASALDEGQQVVVPSTALKELARILSSAETVTLRLGERDVSFDVGDVRVTSRLIDGEFPNYRGLIPASQPNTLRVGRDALLEALRRVRLLAREAAPVRLVMSGDTLELVAITQDVGRAREEIDAHYTGAELTVAFNPDYLIAGIEVTPGDEVTLETIDAGKPALVKAVDNTEFLYLLMPVRVS